MSLTQNILAKTAELSEVDVTYQHTSDFNYIDTLDTNCSAIVMEATVIYFEIKNIPLLLKTGKRLAARMYKIYYNALQEICKNTGGYFSCDSPCSFLMIYPKHNHNVSYVVDVAVKTATLFCTTLREAIEKNSHLSFSMGIDYGNILGTKTIDNDKFTHIVWFSPDIEKAKTHCPRVPTSFLRRHLRNRLPSLGRQPEEDLETDLGNQERSGYLEPCVLRI